MAATAMEPSSSLSFTSSHLSNPSPLVTNHHSSANLEAVRLIKLSSNLEQLLTNPDCDYSDAEIIIEEAASPVSVHRCVLAARSKFFLELFKKDKENSEKKPKYHMKDLLPYGNVGREAFLHFLNYIYTGRLKPFPKEVSTCVDTVCAHDSCKPAIDFAVELMYASYVFQMPELVSSFQRRLCNYVEKSLVENVIPILLVAFHCDLNQLLDQCIERVARSDLDRFCIEKELPLEVSEKIKQLRVKSMNIPEVVDKSPERTGKVLKALDSDDVELVKLLLTESDITLDQANGLHYTVAYSDPKVVTQVLALDMADVNFRNSRGYTVLHFAAMRREPAIIISLLEKGANASDFTFDGRSAVNICRRLTKPKNYKTLKGQEPSKERLCIDLLEREIRRNPLASGDIPTCSHSMPEDLHMRLLYLEKRVGLAQLIFPAEANVAMDIGNVDLGQVDLNETPYVLTKRMLTRMEALMKTVETGRRFFPSCYEVVDKYMDVYMDEDIPDMSHPEKSSGKERRLKRMRYNELKNDVKKAYSKDKEAKIAQSCLSGSSPASSLREALENQI
ncbi:Regulatory protein NPR4 [Cardamine amara subsp. amara]|uniref:Regulatory protein NPR4 n=1 Tax=Cardamine amara subsp. amara TaxID=228776 RepID=A0ABD1AZT5_CARAN